MVPIIRKVRILMDCFSADEKGIDKRNAAVAIWCRGTPDDDRPLNPLVITPAIRNANTFIPAKAEILDRTGCRIKSGMTKDVYIIPYFRSF
jgi:hypothetical protein